MKTKLLLLFIASILLFNCKKDSSKEEIPNKNKEENPLALYLKNSGFDQKLDSVIAGNKYEYSIEFRPHKKSTITAITLKLPVAKTNIKVTLWDTFTKEILKTYIIPSVQAN